ncbi:peptidoglycan D,D-transpeptidase FtsI family protein [Acidaminobacter hydrogenoformans]|nr:penicillin-binding transpeptidase domain-containing protein [Acidaminobacter hydrogenoformans]
MDTVNSRILHSLVFAGILFVVLITSLTWFELRGKNDIMGNAYNKRMIAAEEEILRGSIIDRGSEILAETIASEASNIRNYPQKRLYAHIIGYHSSIYGKTLLEAKYNSELLGKSNLEFLSVFKKMLSKDVAQGYNLRLTLSHTLQTVAREQLGDRHGAVVALDPRTGEILAMVSTPDFNPNASSLEENWKSLIENENSPLLPRATMGLYPAGSIFKVVTAAAALETGNGDYMTNDQGTTVIDGMTFSNAGQKARGDIGLHQAMTVSSNVYFAELSQKIGAGALIAKAKDAGITKSFDFDLPRTDSRIGDSGMGKTELAATAIGQGKLLVSPLQMAMLAAGVANGGEIMQPYLVKTVENAGGEVLRETDPESLYKWVTPETAELLKEMMVSVVEEGTGTKAQISGVRVAGKTGTAQNEKSTESDSKDHAWFIGFAPAEAPRIAVAVLLEYRGEGGGRAAAPVAAKVMSTWLKMTATN